MYAVIKMKSYDRCAPYLCKIKCLEDKGEALALSREWYEKLGGDYDVDVWHGGRIHFYHCFDHGNPYESIVMVEC